MIFENDFDRSLGGRFRKLSPVKKGIYIFATLCILSVIVLIFMQFDHGSIDITFYNVKNKKLSENMRIVCVSDLHNRQFGKGNERLIEEITKLEPDMIAVVGDLTIYGNRNHDVALNFLEELTKIAPTFYSVGNHEYAEILEDEKKQGKSELRGALKKTGVHFVNNGFETVEIAGNTLNIGGFCARPANFGDNAQRFMDGFIEQEGFKLLLTHHVEVFEEVMEGYPVDLALTAHAHGGQWRLPVVGGLYAPDQGFLPKLTDGQQWLCGSEVIINRGLGNSSPLAVRFNNNPEIVVADLSRY